MLWKLTDQVLKYKLSIVALQELQWPGNGNVKFENYTIFYSRSENDGHEYGVGFMVSDVILLYLVYYPAFKIGRAFLRYCGNKYIICM